MGASQVGMEASVRGNALTKRVRLPRLSGKVSAAWLVLCFALTALLIPMALRLPRWLIFPIAYGAEAVARFTGREPFVTTTGLRLAKDRMFFTSAKAERELGYRARPYSEAIADAIAWFRQHGFLKS